MALTESKPLPVERVDMAADDQALAGMSIGVVGAGPAGLAVAAAAHNYGAKVTVFEELQDPRRGDLRYTGKSFNLTLNNIGRQAVGDPRVWDGGVAVHGRAVHDLETGKVRYASYGGGSEDHLTSIPRPALQRNLAIIASDAGAALKFDTKVVDIDPDKATIEYQQGGACNTFSGDMIVVADGLHSCADKMVAKFEGGDLNIRRDPKDYVTATISPDAGQFLSPHHLHYWHGSNNHSYTIGVPNLDGSISVLFISDFNDIADGAHPFPDASGARERLARDFPQLLEADPTIADQLPGRIRGRFHYKATTHFVLGSAGVKVGDSGRAAPPWAGFGANTAIYSAYSLVDLLVANNGDPGLTLPMYQDHHCALSAELLEFVDDHGDFLSGRVALNPGDRAKPALLGLLQAAAIKSNVYVPTLDRLQL